MTGVARCQRPHPVHERRSTSARSRRVQMVEAARRPRSRSILSQSVRAPDADRGRPPDRRRVGGRPWRLDLLPARPPDGSRAAPARPPLHHGRLAPLAAGADWSAYDGTYSGRRYSPLGQITPGNVAQLRRAWVYHTRDLPAAAATETIQRQTISATANLSFDDAPRQHPSRFYRSDDHDQPSQAPG